MRQRPAFGGKLAFNCIEQSAKNVRLLRSLLCVCSEFTCFCQWKNRLIECFECVLNTIFISTTTISLELIALAVCLRWRKKSNKRIERGKIWWKVANKTIHLRHCRNDNRCFERLYLSHTYCAVPMSSIFDNFKLYTWTLSAKWEKNVSKIEINMSCKETSDLIKSSRSRK